MIIPIKLIFSAISTNYGKFSAPLSEQQDCFLPCDRSSSPGSRSVPPPPLPGLARIHALLLYYIDLARAKSEGPSNKFIIQIKQ